MNFEYTYPLYFIPLVLGLGAIYMWRSRSALERKRFPYFLAFFVCVIVAVSNPYWRRIPAKEKLKGVDLILITDVSQSMFCSVQGKTSRLDLTRRFIKNTLPAFAGSQVALIYFAGDAQLGSPFTSDWMAISLLVDSISPGMSTKAGTHSDPLTTVLDQLLNFRRAERMPLIFLFSDGEFFDGTGALESYVRRNKLKIFTYLSGAEKAPVPNFNLNATVEGAFSTPSAASLQRLARAGNGTFFNLSTQRGDQLIAEMNEKIEDVVVQGHLVPDYRPIPFLWAALFFLLLYQWAPVAIERITPARGLIAAFLLFSTGAGIQPAEERLFQEALQEIDHGKTDQAIKNLNKLGADFPLNEKEIALGNAYFRAGKMQEAVQQYQKVLSRDPYHKIARWNWEVALKKRSDSRQDTPQPRQEEIPQPVPESQNALLQYVDQLEKEQRQKSNRPNIAQSEFAW